MDLDIFAERDETNAGLFPLGVRGLEFGRPVARMAREVRQVEAERAPTTL